MVKLNITNNLNQVNDTIENYVDEAKIRPRRLTAAS